MRGYTSFISCWVSLCWKSVCFKLYILDFMDITEVCRLKAPNEDFILATCRFYFYGFTTERSLRCVVLDEMWPRQRNCLRLWWKFMFRSPRRCMIASLWIGSLMLLTSICCLASFKGFARCLFVIVRYLVSFFICIKTSLSNVLWEKPRWFVCFVAITQMSRLLLSLRHLLCFVIRGLLTEQGFCQIFVVVDWKLELQNLYTVCVFSISLISETNRQGEVSFFPV